MICGIESSMTTDEFVIIPELVLILAPNHGKVFKSFMFAYLPDWAARWMKLRNHSEAHRAC
jgi:predicted metal-dependent hydrolase